MSRQDTDSILPTGTGRSSSYREPRSCQPFTTCSGASSNGSRRRPPGGKQNVKEMRRGGKNMNHSTMSAANKTGWKESGRNRCSLPFRRRTHLVECRIKEVRQRPAELGYAIVYIQASASRWRLIVLQLHFHELVEAMLLESETSHTEMSTTLLLTCDETFHQLRRLCASRI